MIFEDNIMLSISVSVLKEKNKKEIKIKVKALDALFAEYYNKYHVLYQLTLLSELFIIY